jgi:hypothetical protein
MNSTLSEIIRAFRTAQDRGVAALRDQLGLPMPSSNRHWVTLCGELDLNKKRELRGIGIYTHGHGVELTFQDESIDFDWGEHGEGNGFDAWRLWSHCEVNKVFLGKCDHDAIKAWLHEAFQGGELVKDRLLYYLASEHKSHAQSVVK